MAISKQLVTIFARHDPRLWDLFFPHLPLIAHQGAARASKLEQVGLNPQPLPPIELYLAASADAAHGMAQAAITAERIGAEPRKALAESIEDWCGSSPRPWPWPRPWPGPWPPRRHDDEPHPEWDIAAGQLVGAMTLAGIAARMDEGDAQQAIEQAAEQLFSVATAE